MKLYILLEGICGGSEWFRMSRFLTRNFYSEEKNTHLNI